MEPVYLLKPLPEVYLHEVRTEQQQVQAQTQTVPICERVEYPETGGIHIYYKGIDLPMKCFPFYDAVSAVNIVKRFSMFFISFGTKDMLLPLLGFLLTPFKRKIRLLEKLLAQYARLADWILNPYYLKERYYCESAKELMKLSGYFLEILGISKETSHSISRILATIIEYDNVYRYRLEDIFSETSQQQMLLNPRKEIKKILKLLADRDIQADVGAKFISIGKMLSLALLIPKIKKAFKTSLAKIDFTKLQLDEIDRYWCYNRGDYNFFGENIHTRLKKFVDYHKGKLPPTITIGLQTNN